MAYSLLVPLSKLLLNGAILITEFVKDLVKSPFGLGEGQHTGSRVRVYALCLSPGIYAHNEVWMLVKNYSI